MIKSLLRSIPGPWSSQAPRIAVVRLQGSISARPASPAASASPAWRRCWTGPSG
ncbi:hypothetical protein ACFQY5_10375 [Paeniroseomonas aquatica]|uniref:hypothetical protein n=1 Tax=Paeniroseomonas aquatica TaxID=373043 RepID=UPI0036182B54